MQLDLFSGPEPPPPTLSGAATAPSEPAAPADASAPGEDSGEWLAEGFALHAQRWAREAGATPQAAAALRHAARCVSLATTAGHVCTELAEIAPATGADAERLRTLLVESGVVGTPEAPSNLPLIVDRAGRLYLHRYFDYERRLALRLMPAPDAEPLEPPGAAAQAELRRLFRRADATGPQRADWQQAAVALALLGRLTIISGGPGTGKTTTVVNLLACLLSDDPACRIALAAPTGKAAARLLDALQRRAGHLPPATQAALPRESFTVHRLLGATPDTGRFRHDATRPLAIDALVVDEASMLDLALATRLFEAVPRSARIILLGDKDQLAAVESGAVFAELSGDPTLSPRCVEAIGRLCATPAEAIRPPVPVAATGLRDSVVWLQENFRFGADSAIGRLAGAINRGDAGAALALLGGASDASLRWLDDASPRLADATLQRIADGYAGYIDTVRADPADRRAISAAFGRYRVLCALHGGARGVDAVNDFVGRRMRRALGDASAGSAWYPGRPVIVLRNDYLLGVYNGDVGIALPDNDGRLTVCFAAGEDGFRCVSPLRLPEHQTAFAMTVHKAQGSEFDSVVLLLPAEASRAVSRELLYTGLTRARSDATLVASRAVMKRAIESPTRRHSGLVARVEALRGS